MGNHNPGTPKDTSTTSLGTKDTSHVRDPRQQQRQQSSTDTSGMKRDTTNIKDPRQQQQYHQQSTRKDFGDKK